MHIECSTHGAHGLASKLQSCIVLGVVRIARSLLAVVKLRWTSNLGKAILTHGDIRG